MDEISRQLKSEIQALQEYIERTADRYLATVWVSRLLPVFDRLEDHLGEDELRQVLVAFHHAQHHFVVNGLLAPQLQTILDRYEDLVAHLPAVASADDDEERNDVMLFPESDPEVSPPLSTHLLFEEEDEELAEVIETAGPEPEEATSLFTPLDFSGDELFTRPEESGSEEEAATAAPQPAAAALPVPAGEPTDASDADDLFAAEETFAVAPAPAPEAPAPAAAPAPEQGNADLLFKNQAPSSASSSTATPRAKPAARSSSAPTRPAAGSRKKTSRRPAPRSLAAKRKEPESLVDIFATKISLEELQAGLGISLPKQDLVNLQVRLRDKIVSDEIPALSSSQTNQGQFILMPRLARFMHKDQLYPCTVKNLAKVFSGLFGDLRDLVRYREYPFTSYEYPELGWSLITPESVREGLDKNYMEQNQFLRYLATSSGVPSHRVRRRTLVEAVYDLIVGRLVLDKRLQQQTIDWTGSGPTKNDFICLYYPPEGIRIRDLPRTAHYRALGVCPNW